MSRAIRRAQRQKIEDIAVDEEIETQPTSKVNPFDLLNDNDNDDDDDDEIQPIKITPVQTKKKKKKTKKVEEDFDTILAQHAAAIVESKPEQTATFNLAELLSVDIKMLDPNVEMRRLFGSKVVSEKRKQVRGRKSVLVPVDDFPTTIKGGLEMEMLEDIDGIRTFKFVHSKAYQATQMMFIQGVQSGDPQNLMNLLARHPFHVDTLLQVSEIMRHQGDGEQSSDMLNRALYSFDRAFHPLFNLATGLVRLPFEYPENRPFYLAIYRYIQQLGRRGCWATAFEFNKLLYALAPEEDPYAALLSIDFYAIKAKRWDYIEKLLVCPWSQVLDDDYPKPNFLYADGVAKFNKNENKFIEAARKFPYIVGSLFQELKSPGPVQFNVEPSDQFSCLMRDLYVFRAKDIYNTPEMTKFLRTATLEVTDFSPFEFPPIPMNVCRHILLLDERSLLHYLPKEVTAASHLSYDPLPPADSVASYMDTITPEQSSVPSFIQDLLRRILPQGHGHLDDEQLAAIMQDFDMEDEFADPNGYGPNRGIDEPDQEGNAGR